MAQAAGASLLGPGGTLDCQPVQRGQGGPQSFLQAYNAGMFRILWIASWIGLLVLFIRSLAIARAIAMALGNGQLQPQDLSIWQMGILPFSFFALLLLFFALKHFRVHTPSQAHWKQLVGIWIMAFWLLLFGWLGRLPA